MRKKVKSAQQLKATDNEMHDDVLAEFFCSLPGHYNPLIMALVNYCTKLTTDLVKERLLLKAAKLEKEDKDSALLMNQRKRFKGNTKAKFLGKCLKCRETDICLMLQVQTRAFGSRILKI